MLTDQRKRAGINDLDVADGGLKAEVKPLKLEPRLRPEGE